MSYFNWRNNEAAIAQPPAGIRVDVQSVLQWVYLWMFAGLAVSGIAALATVNTPALLNLVSGPALFIAIILELVLVFALSLTIHRLSPAVGALMFFAYSALNGFTLSVVLLVYAQGTLVTAFAATAGLFAAMTVVGFTTDVDLSKIGNLLWIGLIGILIAMVVNFFVGSSALSFVISILGVVVFTGLTAWDTQKIKRMANDPRVLNNGATAMRLSILGALMLYLDFINLFLFLLRLLGGGGRD